MTPEQNKDNDFSLLPLLLFLIDRKKIFAINLVVCSVISLIVVFALTKKYSATFSFLPPASSGGYAALLGGLKGEALLDGESPSTEQILFILSSRAVREPIIEKFGLIKRYKLEKNPNKERLVLKKFDKNISVDFESKGGLGVEEITGVSVTVTDRSPDTAFLIASELHVQMERVITDVYTKKAEKDMAFFKKMTEEQNKTYEAAQSKFIEFQKTNKIYAPDEQFSYLVRMHSELEMQIQEKQIALKLLKQNRGSNSSEVVKLVAEINTLTEELNTIRNKKGVSIVPALSMAPDRAMEYFNLKTELELQEKGRILLYQMYRQAEFQSKKNIPVLKIVDKPVKPEYKSKPKRLYVAIAITAIETILLTILLIVQFVRDTYLVNDNRYKAIITALVAKR